MWHGNVAVGVAGGARQEAHERKVQRDAHVNEPRAAARHAQREPLDELRGVAGRSEFASFLEQAGLTPFRGDLDELGCAEAADLTHLTDEELKEVVGMSDDQIASLRESLKGFE